MTLESIEDLDERELALTAHCYIDRWVLAEEPLGICLILRDAGAAVHTDALRTQLFDAPREIEAAVDVPQVVREGEDRRLGIGRPFLEHGLRIGPDPT